jgi:hypothetical protein
VFKSPRMTPSTTPMTSTQLVITSTSLSAAGNSVIPGRESTLS